MWSRRELLVAGILAALGRTAPAHAGSYEPAPKGGAYRRTVERYALPDVTLINQDGKKGRLPAIADPGRPVLLNFVFTSCTTVCAPMAAGFAEFQAAIGAEAAGARLISISIDPHHDTPAVLKQYRERFGGRPGWELLTGRPEDILRVMRALDAIAENKMNHYPLTFLRAPGTDTWVRIDGLLATTQLLTEYRRLVSQ
jgi:protein SCO1/2